MFTPTRAGCDERYVRVSDFNFSIRLTPRFFDLDVYRHVNNAVYSTYCEEARAAYCRHLNIFLPDRKMIGFVIAKAEMEFLAPVKLGEDLEVFIRSANWGRARFDFFYLITGRNLGKNVFRGRTTCVCWDVNRKKPVPLDSRERAIMGEFESGSRG